MDPISQPALNGVTVDPAGAAQVRQASDQATFQSIYREALSESPAARPIDPQADMRVFGQQFRDFERGLQMDREGMLRVLMPPPSSAGAAQGDYRSSAPGLGSGERGRFEDAGSRMLARDSDRIGGGAPRQLFSDRTSDMAPPVIQSALGIASETNTSRIDFAGEISGLSARIGNTMDAIKERIADNRPKSPEEAMRHNSEVQGLVRESDNLNSERSMMMSLHLAAHQESRTRLMSAFEHVVGMTKKINEIFNQLKQSS
ncbi:MAG TPA: hypothetical protein VLQ65_14095 [Saliniramus sp.]|nr:hypothetical protein [Saliniramus sp.]